MKKADVVFSFRELCRIHFQEKFECSEILKALVKGREVGVSGLIGRVADHCFYSNY